jgi:hypothetical protein
MDLKKLIGKRVQTLWKQLKTGIPGVDPRTRRVNVSPWPVAWSSFIHPIPNPTIGIKVADANILKLDPLHFHLLNSFLVVWAPHIFFNEVCGNPPCPLCGNNTNVQCVGWSDKIRRVFSLGIIYYVVSYPYMCKGCPGACMHSWQLQQHLF